MYSPIKRLTLKNFRKHREFEATFERGFNTIVGSNNSGKTTLIRALQFLAFRDRTGRDHALTHGTRSGMVEVEFYNGVVIRRDFSHSKRVVTKDRVNRITIQVPGEPEETYNQPTPDVISQHIAPLLARHGLGPLHIIGRDDVWPQFHPSRTLFLLGEGPAVMKDSLSAWSYTDVFEHCQGLAQKKGREANRAAQEIEGGLLESEEQVAFDRVTIGAAAPLLGEFWGLLKQYDTLDEKVTLIEPALSAARAQRARLGDDPVGRQKKLQKAIDLLQVHRSELDAGQTKLLSFERSIRQVREAEKSWDPARAEQVPLLVSEAASIRTSMTTMKQRIRESESALLTVRTLAVRVEEANERVEAATAERDRVKAEARELGVCPLCGRGGGAAA